MSVNCTSRQIEPRSVSCLSQRWMIITIEITQGPPRWSNPGHTASWTGLLWDKSIIWISPSVSPWMVPRLEILTRLKMATYHPCRRPLEGRTPLGPTSSSKTPNRFSSSLWKITWLKKSNKKLLQLSMMMIMMSIEGLEATSSWTDRSWPRLTTSRWKTRRR